MTKPSADASAVPVPHAKAADIESHLKEKRVFKPAAKFAQAARIGNMKKYQKMHKASLKNPDKFWARRRPRS